MSGLAEFLLARIAEDEEAACAAQDAPQAYDRSDVDAWDETIGLAEDEGARAACTDLMRRITPARVLAESEAKRVMVTRFAELLRSFDNPGSGPWLDVNRRERHQARDNLFRMAAVYADHPDYPEEWRP